MATDLDKTSLKISIWNRIYPHFPVFFNIPFGILIMYYVFNFEFYTTLVFLCFWSIDIIPSLYLHNQYLKVNKDKRYKVFFDRIVGFSQEKQKDYLASDIEQITVYLYPNLYNGSNFHFFGIESYYYARVELTNGEHFFLTCLLNPKLDKILKQLKGVRIERKKSLFPSLK